MLSFRPLATLLALPLLLGAAVLVAGGRPTPVAAVGDCEISFNLFDANATNAGSVTPGGTSTLLAYPGYTNGTTVGIDISSTNPSSCSALGRSNFYALFSRWHEVLFGKSIDGAAANAELAANYGQIDHIPARYAIATQAFDYKNDFGPGYATPAAAAFDLSAAATMTLASGSEVSVYGDITRCAKKQGLTRGFAPAYVARDIAAAGGQPPRILDSRERFELLHARAVTEFQLAQFAMHSVPLGLDRPVERYISEFVCRDVVGQNGQVAQQCGTVRRENPAYRDWEMQRQMHSDRIRYAVSSLDESVRAAQTVLEENPALLLGENAVAATRMQDLQAMQQRAERDYRRRMDW